VQSAAYVQDEVRLGRWMLATAGLRYDRYEDFARVTPRAALILTPSYSQSFKYLYGQAFRAPNAYEPNDVYFGDRVRPLRPESIDTHEVVWERYTDDWLRTSVSTYWYRANRLITLVPDPSTFLATTFVNSPAQMAKLRLSVPGPFAGSSVSTEILAMGSRRTLAGATLPATAVVNLTTSVPLSRRVELVAGANNLFDLQYADPASDQHRQDVIAQHGRTLRAGLRWTFGRKETKTP
jgi:outer membrane receptor protein involved in Fe transport